MFYEEKVINGVLCCRGTPDGEWEPMSPVALTERICILQAQYDELSDMYHSQL